MGVVQYNKDNTAFEVCSVMERERGREGEGEEERKRKGDGGGEGGVSYEVKRPYLMK